MPKAKKLHSKGKPTSIQKQINLEETSNPEDNTRQFQLELCWCIQQLEKFMSENKGNEKQMQDTWKVLTVLKNNNQPLIRKRQLMRTHFGDYRAKMAAEEKKLAKTLASKMKITESTEKPKATFLRKSTFLTTGSDSFRFNFNLGPKQKDQSNSNSTEKTEEKQDVGNTSSEQHVAGNTSSEKAEAGNASVEKVEAGNISLEKDDSKSVEKVKKSEESPKEFKFTFTSSQFKFNFTPEPSNS